MTITQALILSVVEGITEYLPVSSTGHMIICSSLMGIAKDDFTKTFTVAIQFGAILSVVMLYFKRFMKDFDFYVKLLCGFIPTAVLGLIFNKRIDALLENVTVVGFMLLAGGVVFLFIDKWFEKTEIKGSEDVTYLKAAKIGLFQSIAMIPGVSRSAATIIGGLAQQLNRKTAAEFSFFLAVPTMFAATLKKLFDLYKTGGEITIEQFQILAIGNVVSFIVAAIAIKTFITMLTNHGFKIFGYYRIIIGLLILGLHYAGIKLEIL